MRPSTVRPVARSEERNRDIVPTPRCARRPSTRNSLFPAEGGYPQNYMLIHKKLQISIQWTIYNHRTQVKGILISRIFEMLDARIASPLINIIQNSYFKKKVSLRGRQIAYMIYDYFRVAGAHDTVLDYADLFTVNDDVQEFDTRWDEILLSMSKTPPYDVL